MTTIYKDDTYSPTLDITVSDYDTVTLIIGNQQYPVSQQTPVVVVSQVGTFPVYIRTTKNSIIKTTHIDTLTVKSIDEANEIQDALDKINNAILNYTGGIESMSIAGRSITYRSIDDLFKLKTHYTRKLDALKHNNKTILKKVKIKCL